MKRERKGREEAMIIESSTIAVHSSKEKNASPYPWKELDGPLRFSLTFEAKDGSTVVLRPAQEQDATGIIEAAKVIVAAGRYIEKEDLRSLDEEIELIRYNQEKDNLYIVAEVDGEIAGIARVMRGELSLTSHVGFLRIWLGEKAQGKGIGKRMMAYVLEWGRRAPNLRKITLHVYAGNEVAHKLYQRMGFVDEGVQKDHAIIDGAYQDEYIMAYFYEARPPAVD
ncbi:GNAT family N-acetyltransferase [Marinicrinis sediminis]|uniref:GNAT family N-acetyltransferase n=1 Tax=Marinicrinis sediminis TaxID=1652465 RepID=A0ABW5R6K5_9BACL